MLITILAAAALVEFGAAFWFYFTGDVLRAIFWMLTSFVCAGLIAQVGDFRRNW